MIVRLIKPWMFPDAEVRYPARQFNLSGEGTPGQDAS
jgi:hypothetical protein